MSEKFPPLPIKKLKRILKRMGFDFDRQSGGHLIFERDSRILSIPHKSGKKDVPVATVLWALNKAGSSREEFMDAYKGKKTRKK